MAFRNFNVDLSPGNRRDWTFFLLFGVLIHNIIGAAWGTLTLNFGLCRIHFYQSIKLTAQNIKEGTVPVPPDRPCAAR